MRPIARRSLLALGVLGLVAGAGSAEDQSFDSAGVRIRYIEEGQGEPVVLVHGYTSNAEAQWARTGVLQALAGQYRVIAMDVRGHGRSGKPHDAAQYGPEMGLDILRLLDHLGIRRAHMNPAQVVTEAQITAVAVPTLGVVGTADPYLSQFQALKAVMPQLQLVTIEGASHGSAPGRSEFTRAILTFLRAHPAVSDR